MELQNQKFNLEKFANKQEILLSRSYIMEVLDLGKELSFEIQPTPSDCFVLAISKSDLVKLHKLASNDLKYEVSYLINPCDLGCPSVFADLKKVSGYRLSTDGKIREVKNTKVTNKDKRSETVFPFKEQAIAVRSLAKLLQLYKSWRIKQPKIKHMVEHPAEPHALVFSERANKTFSDLDDTGGFADVPVTGDALFWFSNSNTASAFLHQNKELFKDISVLYKYKFNEDLIN